MPNSHVSHFPSGPTSNPSRRQTTSASSRLTHIDAIRGLLLVLMAVNHITSDLQVVTDHPLGFMSAAEGFVFMAGLMAGYVYTRKWLRGNFDALRRACTGRALSIYRWHALIYVLVFAGLAAVGFTTGALPINTPPAMLEHPPLSLVSGLLLVQQPTLFDILPLYCLLLVATPWLLHVCSLRAGYTRLIFASLSIWAAANIFCPQVPFDHGLINTGAFNLAAWQLLYVGGLAFGHRWATRQQVAATSDKPASQTGYLLSRPSTPVLIGLAAIAATLFSVRHGFLPSGLSERELTAVTNKNNLAPVRLLDTALILYLGYQVISRSPHLFSWRPLAWIGQASLAVFSTHVLTAYAIHAFPEIFVETTAGRWSGTALMMVAISSTAAVQALLARKPDPHPHTSAPRPANSPPALQTRQPRTRRIIVRHEPRPPVPADSFHR